MGLLPMVGVTPAQIQFGESITPDTRICCHNEMYNASLTGCTPGPLAGQHAGNFPYIVEIET